MKRKLLTCLAAIVFATSAMLKAQLNDDVDQVVAIVDDTVITSMDVKQKIDAELKQLKQAYRGKELDQNQKKLFDMALDAMINKELIYLDFKALKASLPPHIVQSRIDRAIASAAAGDAIKFEESLYQQGMTMAEFREQLHKEIAVEMLLRNKIQLGVSVSDQAIQAYYDQHRFEMSKPNRYHLAALLLKPDGKNRGNIQKAVKDIEAKLAAKTPFKELVKTYSDGPNAENGGDLGWMDAPAKQLLMAVRDLEKGETTPKPFKIGNNLYFIHVIDLVGGGIPQLDDTLKQKLKKKIAKLEEQKRYHDYIRELHMKFPVRRMGEPAGF